MISIIKWQKNHLKVFNSIDEQILNDFGIDDILYLITTPISILLLRISSHKDFEFSIFSNQNETKKIINYIKGCFISDIFRNSISSDYQNIKEFEFSSKSLNSFISWHSSELMEIVGPSGVGKSMFCLNILLSTINDKSNLHNIFLINSGDSFSASRLEKAVLNSFTNNDKNTSEIESEKRLIDVFERIQISKVRDFYDLNKILDELEISLREEYEWYCLLDVIIIDSIYPLISSLSKHHSFDKIIQLGKRLRIIAREFNLFIVLTNSVINVNNKVVTALGATWSSLIDQRIMMNDTESYSFENNIMNDERILSLVKSTRNPLTELPISLDISGISPI